MKKRSILRYGIIAGAVAVIVLLTVLALRPEATRVQVGRASYGELREILSAEGVTRYHDSYLVAAPITGLIERTSLRAGDPVVAGQSLMRIAPPPVDPRQSSELTLRSGAADALVEETRQRVEQARGTLERAERERERLEVLLKSNATSPTLYDDAILAERTSQREFDAWSKRLIAVEHDAAAAHTLTAVHGSRILRSPATGVVLRVLEPDARVVPAGTPLVEVGDPAAIEAVIDVLSSDAPLIQPGGSVLLQVPGVDTTIRASVRLVEPTAFVKISPLGIEERRVNVILDLAANRSVGNNYRVDASFILWQKENALRVPISALVRRGGAWAVFAIREGTAKLRTVRVGHRGEDYAEILEGITADEQVVQYPEENLQDGARVQAR